MHTKQVVATFNKMTNYQLSQGAQQQHSCDDNGGDDQCDALTDRIQVPKCTQPKQTDVKTTLTAIQTLDCFRSD